MNSMALALACCATCKTAAMGSPVVGMVDGKEMAFCSIECLFKGPKKPPKYGNRKTVDSITGRTFDSKHEAEVARWLWARQEAGEVRNLAFQTRYRIEVNDELICTYVSDFDYDERRPEWDTSMGPAWVAVVADAKGFRTREYRIKKRLMKAVFNIDVTEL